MRTKLLYLLIALMLLAGCEKLFLGDEPTTNPKETFHQFWLDFDRYYAHFAIKPMNWDSVYQAHYPQLTHATTERELLSRLGQIILALQDAHVDLYTGTTVVSYPYYQNSPLNAPVNLQRYISFGPGGENADIIAHGQVKGTNLGYIRLKTFAGFGKQGQTAAPVFFRIDQILKDYESKDGLIVDVRSNGGGNLVNVEVIASRFADRERRYLRQKYKRGPKPEDFTDWIDYDIKPAGQNPFLKPVLVLTNKQVGSAAESFVLAMRSFPHVLILGDTTAGASGNPVFRELPNGWTMRLSVSYAATNKDFVFEGKGLPPDIPLWISEEDVQAGRDAILEKAIEVLGALISKEYIQD